jgi:hypothetical protein
MGMFDSVAIDPPLVISDAMGKLLNTYSKYDYQTKSFDNLLWQYKIDSTRKLMRLETSDEDVKPTLPDRWVFCNHTGIVEIYDYQQLKTHKNGDPYKTRSITLRCKFLDGNLLEVKKLEDVIKKHKKKKPFTLADHIKKIVNLNYVIIEPTSSYNKYAFTIQKHKTTSKWCIYTHSVDAYPYAYLDLNYVLIGYQNNQTLTPPAAAFLWDDEYAASEFLHGYFKKVKTNKIKVKVK